MSKFEGGRWNGGRFHSGRFAGVSEAADVVSVPFGARTLAGAGGVAKPAGATAISNPGVTNLVLSAGYAVPDTGGTVTSGTVTWDDGTTWTVTAVADAYSAKDIDEVLAAAHDATLALGDQILLRAGEYNSARASKLIRRSTNPSGTWSGSNYVIIKPHTDEEVTLHWLTLKNDLGGTNYFSIEGIIGDTGAMDALQSAVIEFDTGPTYCRVKDCTFTVASHSPTTASSTTLGKAIHSGVGTYTATGTVVQNVSIDGAWTGIALAGSGMTIENVTVKNAYADSFTFLVPMDGLTMTGCVSTDSVSAYTEYTVTAITTGNPTLVTVSDATGINVDDDCRIFGLTGSGLMDDGIYNISNVAANVLTVDVNTTGGSYTSGGTLQASGTHADHVQLLGSGGSAGDMDDMTFVGNVFTRGNGTAGWPDKQGFFGSNNSFDIDNMTVNGMLIACSLGAGFAFERLTNARIKSVVVAGIPDAWTGHPYPSFQMNTSGSGNVVEHTIAHGLADSTTSTMFTNNNFVLGQTEAALLAAFDDPQVGGVEETITSANYATKTGSAGDTATPKQGATPYQSFTTPWTYSDPDPVFIVSTNPLDGAIGVAVATNPTVTFNENISFGTGDITLWDTDLSSAIEVFDVTTDTGGGAGTVSISGAVLTIEPTADFSAGQAVAILWDAGAVENGSAEGVLALTDVTKINFQATSVGPELFADATFDNASAWTMGTGTSLGSGQVTWNTTSTFQQFTTVDNTTWRLGGSNSAEALTPSTSYTMIIDVASITTNQRVRVIVEEYNSGGTYLRTATPFDTNTDGDLTTGENSFTYTTGADTVAAFVKFEAVINPFQSVWNGVSCKEA